MDKVRLAFWLTCLLTVVALDVFTIAEILNFSIENGLVFFGALSIAPIMFVGIFLAFCVADKIVNVIEF